MPRLSSRKLARRYSAPPETAPADHSLHAEQIRLLFRFSLVGYLATLLVIFILTAPMFTHSIRLELPQEQAAAAQRQPDTVNISIDADGKLFWNDQPVDEAG